jgi:hypothetical protein
VHLCSVLSDSLLYPPFLFTIKVTRQTSLLARRFLVAIFQRFTYHHVI